MLADWQVNGSKRWWLLPPTSWAVARGFPKGHERARQEAQRLLQADARGNALARAYREATDLSERSAADRERLEFIERSKPVET